MTLAVVGATAVFLIAYDFWVGLSKGSDQTISWQMYQLALKYPIVPFGLGILFGHLFWVQHGG